MDLYIVIGCQGAGRREVVLDLIRFGTEVEAGGNVVLLSEDEQANPLDENLNGLPNAQVLLWRWDEGNITCELWPQNTGRVFFLTDGLLNLIDQLEALRAWIPLQDLQLALVYAVAHTQLMYRSSKARRWHEACIHFADVVFLNHRDDVPNKWLGDFIKEHRNKLCYPCLFEMVKKGKVKQHAQLLYPEARRMTTIFDDLDADQESAITIVTEGNYDGDDDPDIVEQDPYLILNPDGRRNILLPEVKDFLNEPA